MSNNTIAEAINLAFHQEMKKDKTVLIIGEDVGVDGGVFRVTQGLIEKFGEERVFDTPLAESAIVGAAVGLALYGFKPVCEIQFSGFIYPAFDQIINHVARFRTRTRGQLSCPLVIRAPFCGGIRALEHHSESMEALYAHIPGLKVVIPSNPYDAKGLMLAAIRDPDPVLFLEPKRIYRAIKQEVPEEDYIVPLGKAKILQEGTDITLVAWGAMVREVQNAADQVDLSCEIIDVRTISPLDTETIINSVKKTGRCIIVHEAPRSGGIAGEISARIMEKALANLQAPVLRVTGYDTVFPLYKLENDYLPSPEKIIEAMKEVMQF